MVLPQLRWCCHTLSRTGPLRNPGSGEQAQPLTQEHSFEHLNKALCWVLQGTGLSPPSGLDSSTAGEQRPQAKRPLLSGPSRISAASRIW